MAATTFEVSAFTARGTARDRVSLPTELFDGTVNVPVMHQAVKAYLANQRQGNASTKTRGLVVGGNQKPWRQKGTGRARQGSIRAPHYVGGGTVFGPSPRGYTQQIPRRIKALARKSALNARAREGAIFVVDRLDFDAPRTARIAGLLERLGLAGKKVLVLTDGVKNNVFLSGRNLPRVHVMPYSDVSAFHLLWSDAVLIEGLAIGQDLTPLVEPEPAAEPKKKPTAAEKKAPARKSKATAAPKKPAAEKKSAAKKAKPASKKATKPAARKATKKSAAKKSATGKSTRGSAAKGAAKKASTGKKTAAKKSSGKKKGGK